MAISVSPSLWGPRVRAQVETFAERWPTFSWGTYPGHDPSEALATDGMVPGWDGTGGKARGRAVAQAIWDDRKNNGVWYVIHWGEIISITRPEKGWLPYFARNDPSPSKSHKNHVHVSWHAENAAPSLVVDAQPYTPGWVPERPWTFYLDRQHVGVTKSDSVWLLQKALGFKPYDGTYTDELQAAVKKWQVEVVKDEPKYCDGFVGRKQADVLFNHGVKIKDKA